MSKQIYCKCTACGHRIDHRKWKEIKLQPGTADPSLLPNFFPFPVSHPMSAGCTVSYMKCYKDRSSSSPGPGFQKDSQGSRSDKKLFWLILLQKYYGVRDNRPKNGPLIKAASMALVPSCSIKSEWVSEAPWGIQQGFLRRASDAAQPDVIPI